MITGNKPRRRISTVKRHDPRPTVQQSDADAGWRERAAQNPMRATYPSWRPREYWEAKSKADPWVLMNGTRDWRKADPHKATFIVRTPHAGFQETQKCDPPSGMDLRPVTPGYKNADEGTKRRRNNW